MIKPAPVGSEEHDKQVKELAKLLHEAHRVQLIEQVKKLTYDTKRFESFLLSLRAESDRALPIVLFAFVEDQLHDHLLRVLNPETVGGLERLFESLGPLATASARIKVASALGWLHNNTAQGLELLRKIRNEFAHYPFTHGFDDRRIIGYVSSMEPVEGRLFGGMDGKLRDPATLTRRTVYHVRATTLVQRMTQELLTAPLAKNMGLHPMTALHDGKDEEGKLPTLMRDLSIAAARVIVVLMGTPEALAEQGSQEGPGLPG